MTTNMFLKLMLLFLSLISIGNSSEYIGQSNVNITCPGKYESCVFPVTTNYPISKRIHTSLPTNAILSSYKYIYLLFDIPKSQKQKVFFLEAYYTSDKETIITNGNCYFINTTNNTDYEIRIYKKLREKDFIRFEFLGLPENFIMTVTLRFTLDVNLYLHDFALTYYNSLNISEQIVLKEYYEKKNKQLELQKERQEKSKEMIITIIQKLFGTTININYFLNDDYTTTGPFYVPPCFIVTVSYAIGLELSTESFFQPEGITLMEVNHKNLIFNVRTEDLDFIKKNVKLDNFFIKLIDSYIHKTFNLIIDLGIETENYSVILSFDTITKCLILTFRFYYKNTLKIYYEIEIKIEFINKTIKKKILDFINSFDYSNLPIQISIDDVILPVAKILKALAIAYAILKIIGKAGALLAGLSGGGIIAFIISLFESLVPKLA